MYRTSKKSRNGDVDEGADNLMADTLIAGTTLVEKESRSIGDIVVGGIVEWDDTFSTIPEGFNLCDGSTISDPLSSYNGSAVPDLNTEYLSIPASQWIANNPNSDDVTHGVFVINQLLLQAGGISFTCGINLPHGATVTACIVDGSAGTTDEDWKLQFSARDSITATDMATEKFGTEETTIASATIDNENNVYGLSTSGLTNADVIHGARITYTPRFKFIIRVR